MIRRGFGGEGLCGREECGGILVHLGGPGGPPDSNINWVIYLNCTGPVGGNHVLCR